MKLLKKLFAKKKYENYYISLSNEIESVSCRDEDCSIHLDVRNPERGFYLEAPEGKSEVDLIIETGYCEPIIYTVRLD